MKSSIIKRSVIIDGHKTSVSLEDAFWSDLKEIAHRHQSTLSKLVTQIDETRQKYHAAADIAPKKAVCLGNALRRVFIFRYRLKALPSSFETMAGAAVFTIAAAPSRDRWVRVGPYSRKLTPFPGTSDRSVILVTRVISSTSYSTVAGQISALWFDGRRLS